MHTHGSKWIFCLIGVDLVAVCHATPWQFKVQMPNVADIARSLTKLS